jgi:1-deoxy-D-xylulose-5-phosphate reductoisomerase
MKKIVVLGSTGSVGRQTLDVIHYHPGEFTVVGLASRFATDVLIEQIRQFHPEIVSVLDQTEKKKVEKLIFGFTKKPKIVCGISGLNQVASYPSAKMVVMALVGLAGLEPTLTAIKSHKDIALATKEVMVVAGKMVRDAVNKFKVHLVPVDSEHSAIFQCLNGEKPSYLQKIILTCSGGPFRQKTKEELKKVTAAEAFCHPTWKMGRKITLDCATLMNKGLEILEAKWLFDVDLDHIEVVVHPQSIIHSLVEFKDGNVAAILSVPDMRHPIQYALSYPNRLTNGFAKSLNLSEIGSLSFEKPDVDRFPCLALAIKAGKIGGTMPTVLVAADEVAVEKFSQGEISFNNIADIVQKTMVHHEVIKNPTLAQILEVDRWARITSKQLIIEEDI